MTASSMDRTGRSTAGRVKDCGVKLHLYFNAAGLTGKADRLGLNRYVLVGSYCRNLAKGRT